MKTTNSVLYSRLEYELYQVLPWNLLKKGEKENNENFLESIECSSWSSSMLSVMNKTKWYELQMAMYELKELCPEWRTSSLANGYLSEWDGDWYYHFSEGGYKDIEWVEIKIENVLQKEVVLSELQKIHVPGHETEQGFKVYGYIQEGKSISYL